ncbi:hypothetical protein HDU80_001879 [Chytriomyces hyalinus]|nr:hypothetical protein HDU80_001879 [Chytriomyces hyalinus]
MSSVTNGNDTTLLQDDGKGDREPGTSSIKSEAKQTRQPAAQTTAPGGAQNSPSPSQPSPNSDNGAQPEGQSDNGAQPEGQQVPANTERATAVGTQTGTALASATVSGTDGPLFGGIATEGVKTGAIVGSLIGVIAVLGLVAGFLLYRRKYMNKNRPKTDSEREALEVSDQFLPSPATVQLEILASLAVTLREYETLVSQKAAIVAAHERDLTSNAVTEKTSASSSLFAKFEPSNESNLSSSHRFALPADPINWTEEETAQWILEKFGNPTLSSLALNQKINGRVLLLMERQDLKSELGLQTFGEQRLFEEAIAELQRKSAQQYALAQENPPSYE